MSKMSSSGRGVAIREAGGLVDWIASAWIAPAGAFSLLAMAASAGMIPVQTNAAEAVFGFAYVILLIGCVAGAASCLARRLHREP